MAIRKQEREWKWMGKSKEREKREGEEFRKECVYGKELNNGEKRKETKTKKERKNNYIVKTEEKKDKDIKKKNPRELI